MKHSIFLILIAIFPLLLQGQNNHAFEKTDSLKFALQHTYDSTAQCITLINISNHFLSFSADSGLHYARRAWKMAQHIESDSLKSKSSIIYGKLLYQTQDYENCIKILQNCNSCLLKNRGLLSHGAYFELLGAAFFKTGNMEEALNYYLKTLKIFTEINENRGLSQIYNNIGLIYYELEDPSEATNYFMQSLNIKKSLKDSLGISTTLNNLGELYIETNQYKIADEYLQHALFVSEKINDQEGVAYILNNKGRIAFFRNRPDSALSLFYQALQIYQTLNSNDGIAQSNYQISRCFLATEQTDSAYFYANKALILASKNNNIKLLKNIMMILSKISYATGDYKNAYHYLQQHHTIADTLLNLNTTRKLHTLALENRFKQKQQARASQQRYKKLLNTSLISGLLILLLAATLLINRQKIIIKQKLQKELLLKKQQEFLEQNLTQKNQELTSKLMIINQKNNVFIAIDRKLKKLSLTLKKPQQESIHEILNDIKIEKNIKFWNEFETLFTNVHPSFFNNLLIEHPDLTHNEKRLCAFLKMNLSTKEIATITLQSTQTLTIARSRLRKKLNITGQEISLYQHLSKY